jgi:hypothetical protein
MRGLRRLRLLRRLVLRLAFLRLRTFLLELFLGFLRRGFLPLRLFAFQAFLRFLMAILRLCALVSFFFFLAMFKV